MANGATTGKSFIAGVLAKLSPEDRQRGEEAWTALQTLGGGTVVAAIGDGVLAQEDFSRQSDALREQAEQLKQTQQELDARDAALQEWHGNLTTWYTDNKATLEAVKKGRNGNPSPSPTPTPTPQPVGITEEALNERIAQERAGYLGLTRDQNLITREHFARFGEVVNIEPLLMHPQIGQVGLLGVYELVHKDRLDKWKTDQQAAHDKKVGEAAIEAFRQSQAQMPYPTPTGVGSGSPLDALESKGHQPVVDAAVAEYNRLQGERAAGRIP